MSDTPSSNHRRQPRGPSGASRRSRARPPGAPTAPDAVPRAVRDRSKSGAAGACRAGAEVPSAPQGPPTHSRMAAGSRRSPAAWQQRQPTSDGLRLDRASCSSAEPARASATATLWCVARHRRSSARCCSATASALNLLIVARARRARRVLRRPAAAVAARAPGPLVWALGGLALLSSPPCATPGWPSFLAVVSAARARLARPARQPHLARRPPRPARALRLRSSPGCAGAGAGVRERVGGFARPMGCPYCGAPRWPRSCSSSSARCSPAPTPPSPICSAA